MQSKSTFSLKKQDMIEGMTAENYNKFSRSLSDCSNGEKFDGCGGNSEHSDTSNEEPIGEGEIDDDAYLLSNSSAIQKQTSPLSSPLLPNPNKPKRRFSNDDLEAILNYSANLEHDEEEQSSGERTNQEERRTTRSSADIGGRSALNTNDKVHREIANRQSQSNKNERRAAFDFLMSRENSFGSTRRQQRPRSQPSSPHISPILHSNISNSTDRRPKSLPGSPYLASPLSPLQDDYAFSSFMLDDSCNVNNVNGEETSEHILSKEKPKVDVAAKNNTASSRKWKVERKVSFDHVEIRSYERILGDNPSCTSGPSISIGWKYSEDDTVRINIDHFEKDRQQTRNFDNLIIPRDEREDMLLEMGYMRSDIACAVRNNIRVKHRRRQTVVNLGAERFEEAVEGVSRKMKKILSIQRKRKPKRTTKANLVQPTITIPSSISKCKQQSTEIAVKTMNTTSPKNTTKQA